MVKKILFSNISPLKPSLKTCSVALGSLNGADIYKDNKNIVLLCKISLAKELNLYRYDVFSFFFFQAKWKRYKGSTTIVILGQLPNRHT